MLRSPPSPAESLRIPAQLGSATTRPVTPEVAGSSPVAPVSICRDFAALAEQPRRAATHLPQRRSGRTGASSRFPFVSSSCLIATRVRNATRAPGYSIAVWLASPRAALASVPAVTDGGEVTREEQLVLTPREQSLVFRVASIVHRGQSLSSHGSILRGGLAAEGAFVRRASSCADSRRTKGALPSRRPCSTAISSSATRSSTAAS